MSEAKQELSEPVTLLKTELQAIKEQTNSLLSKAPGFAMAHDMLRLINYIEFLESLKATKKNARRVVQMRDQITRQAGLLESKNKETGRLRDMLDVQHDRVQWLAEKCDELHCQGPIVKKKDAKHWIKEAAKVCPIEEV